MGIKIALYKGSKGVVRYCTVCTVVCTSGTSGNVEFPWCRTVDPGRKFGTVRGFQ